MTDQDHINEFVKAHKPFAKFGVSLYKITKIESISEESKGSVISDNYWTLGSLVNDVVVGKPIRMIRIANSNHPKGRDGVFATSVVVEYKDDIATTRNSKYKIEKLV